MRVFPFRCCFDFETITPNRKTNETANTRGQEEEEDQNGDRYAEAFTEVPEQDRPRMHPKYRPPSSIWSADHESFDQYRPLNLGDSLSAFLVQNWNAYNSQRVKNDEFRVRLCFPPQKIGDVEMETSKQGVPLIVNEEDTIFRLTALRVREILLCALTLVSRKTRTDVTDIDFRLLLCTDDGDEYRIRETPLFFANFRRQKIDIRNWKLAFSTIEAAIPASTFEKDYAHFLSTSVSENSCLLGPLCLKVSLKSERLVFLYEMVPLSVVCLCNFEDFSEPKFICNENETDCMQGAADLMNEFVAYLLAAAVQAKRLMKIRLKPYLIQMKKKLLYYKRLQSRFEKHLLVILNEASNSKTKISMKRAADLAEDLLRTKENFDFNGARELRLAGRTYKNLLYVWEKLDAYMGQLPCFSYNG